MGMALAVDYTLLILSRFRDELAEGQTRDAALIRTMATAGRTVLFSAMTVALSMATMVLFPQYFLKSFAYAGVAVVAFAAVAAIIVTPAAIVLLGDRLDSLDVRRLLRRSAGPPGAPPDQSSSGSGTGGRSSSCATRCRSVSRHRAAAAARRAVPRCAVGFRRRPGAAHLGFGAPGRRPAAQRLPGWIPTFTVVLPDATDLSPADLDALRRRAVAGARRVVGVFAGRHVRRRQAGRAALAPTGIEDGSAFLTVTHHRAAVSPPPRPNSSTGCTPSPTPAGKTGAAGRVRRAIATACTRSPRGCRWCSGSSR